MAIISTLKRELTHLSKRIDFSKMKFDFRHGSDKVIDKAIRKMSRNLQSDIAFQGYSLKELENTVQSRLKHFKISILECNDFIAQRVCESFLDEMYLSKKFLQSDIFDKPQRHAKVVKIEIQHENKNLTIGTQILTIPGIEVKKNTLKKIYISRYKDLPRDKREYKYLNLSYIVSYLELLEICYDYSSRIDDSLINNKDTYYNELYTKKDLDELLSVNRLNKQDIFPNEKIKNFICENILAMSFTQANIRLDNLYKKNIDSSYSKSFQTKKNIPDKYLSIMKNNKFNDYFSYIELDSETSIEKFKFIEREFLNLKDTLELERFLEIKPELRFKKLGQHKSGGLYYDTLKCICIDIGSPSSFLHELAHHIDKTYRNFDLSSEPKFRMLAILLKESLEQTMMDTFDQKIIKYYAYKKDYFNTPTEIFARCLEMYFVHIKQLKSSFIPSKEMLTPQSGYPPLDNLLKEKLETYFDELFDIQQNLDISIDIKNELTCLEKAAQKINISQNKVSQVESTNYLNRPIELNFLNKISCNCNNNNNVNNKKRKNKSNNVIKEYKQVSFLK